MSVAGSRIATMTTGTITTYSGPHQGSIASLAIRIGRALERWGQDLAQPASREQLEFQMAVEREARAAIAARGDARAGNYGMLI